MPEPIERARHLQRVLGVDYTLAWRAFRVVSVDDPLSAAVDVPLPGQMERLLAAAEKLGAKTASIGRVRQAYTAFEELVHRHAGEGGTRGRGGGQRAGGRGAFDSLITNAMTESGDKEVTSQDLAHRRAAFKSNSHLWGLQCGTLQACVIMRHADPNTIDVINLTGYVQVQVQRPNMPLRLSGTAGLYTMNNPDVLRNPYATANDWHLLEEFGSKPPPRLVEIRDESGMRGTQIEFDGVGRGAAVDFFTAGSTRGFRVSAESGHRGYAMSKVALVPAELLVMDLLVEKGRSNPATFSVSTHGDLRVLESLIREVPNLKLPISEAPQQLGTDLAAMNTPSLPRYAEMVEHLIAQMGWAGTEFDIYRCVVRYPILHTLVHLSVSDNKQP